MMRIVIIFILLLISAWGFGQSSGSPSFGNWTMYFGQFRINDQWSIHAEAQLRDQGIIDQADQVLLRAGLNHHLKNGMLLTSGYGRILGYVADDDYLGETSSAENRVWEQLSFNKNLNQFKLDHRFRLEQRWISRNETTEFKNRIRYLFRITMPLGLNDISEGTWFVSLYDEIFLEFDSKPFDRNRFYGAIGNQLSSNTAVHLGLMVQSTSTESKPYLQIAIFHNLDMRSSD